MSVPRIDTYNEPGGFKRRSTFGFNRTWTENIAFPRAFTEVLRLDDEESWARKLYDEYGMHNKKGVEGDIPG